MWGSKHGGPNNGIIKHALHATEEGYKNNPLNYHLPTERRVIAQCCNLYQDILTHAAAQSIAISFWGRDTFTKEIFDLILPFSYFNL